MCPVKQSQLSWRRLLCKWAALSLLVAASVGRGNGGSSLAVGVKEEPKQLELAPTWAKRYGHSDGKIGDEGHSIGQTSDGGYIVAGTTTSPAAANLDVWVLKLDAHGEIEWQKAYGGSGSDTASSVQQTKDGGYVVAGATQSFGAKNTDFWVLKLDRNGAPQWQKMYGHIDHDEASSIQQTIDGGYIVAGRSGFPRSDYDATLLKLDGSGNIQWQNAYGIHKASDYRQEARYVRQTSDGGYIAAGSSASSTSGYGVDHEDPWAIKLDTRGNIQWQKRYILRYSSEAHAIQQTTSGEYVLMGGDGEAFLLKLDRNGNILWQKLYGDSGDYTAFWGRSFQQTSEGGYILAGKARPRITETERFLVMKLDGTGSIQWQKIYGGSYSAEARSIQETRDKGYVVAGGMFQVRVMKLDPKGDIPGYSSAKIKIENPNALAVSGDATAADTNATAENPHFSVSRTNATVFDTAVSPIEESGKGISVPLPTPRVPRLP